MNPPKFDACLASLRSWAAGLRRGERAIVFGSAARGQAGEDSDLDVLVLAPRARRDSLANVLYDLGARHDVTISPYFLEPGELAGLDRQFLESLARDGIPLKGPSLDPTIRTLDLKPHYLVTLYLDHLPQRAKVALARELYGYRTSRRYKRKQYRSARPGFLERQGGWKLGRGTVLIPAHAWPDLDALIEKHGGKRWGFTVWVLAP